MMSLRRSGFQPVRSGMAWVKNPCYRDQMETVILNKPGEFEVRQTDVPASPPPGHALVRVRRVGICGTDWHAFHGRQPFFTYPRILGHELGVEVEQVNDPKSDLKPGDRCAVE